MSRVGRYLAGAAVVAVAAAALLAGVLAAWRPDGAGWAWVGFGLMAVVGWVGGAWLVRLHGSAGGAFVVAMLACMLARFVLAPLGMFLAARAGGAAPWALLAGLGAGFAPLMGYEVLFLHRRPSPPEGLRVQG